MKKLSVVLLFLCTPASAYTNGEVIEIINANTDSFYWLIGGIVTIAIGVIGWVVNKTADNRERITAIELKIASAQTETLTLINAENSLLVERIELEREKSIASYNKLHDVLELHKLYVANNYTRDTKIQSLIAAEVTPITAQLKTIIDAVTK